MNQKVNIRRNKLTPELTEEICKYISEGSYIETACKNAGINKTTFYDWIKKAEDAYNSGDTDSIYLNFANAIEKADAEIEHKHVKHFNEVALESGNAIPSAIFLSRRFRERWSDRTKYEVDQEADQIANRLLEALQKPQLTEGKEV